MTSVVVKSADEGRVRRAVDDYAARLLSSRADVEEIIVFGSYEQGTYAPGSDVDFFIVLTRADRPVWDRIIDLLPGAFPVGVDLFPYTREEMAALEPSPLLEAVARSRWRYRR
ncbi:MAG: nucleotidyltransferase domain-containing protein, partial [Vicinamibacterales bacterium]